MPDIEKTPAKKRAPAKKKPAVSKPKPKATTVEEIAEQGRTGIPPPSDSRPRHIP